MKPEGVRSGSDLLALRKQRMAAAPAVLQGGFRPFFLAAGLWAIMAVALWLGVVEGGIALPIGFDPLAWHRHEMVFGFAGAAVAGFVLTAIPNWTGRFPVAGSPLAWLVALWTGARLLLLFLSHPVAYLAVLFDAGLFVVLATYALREVRLSKNRNLLIAVLIFLFGASDALDYACATGSFADPLLGIRAALAILVMMITAIGGRIVPSFTRNWLVKNRVGGRLPEQTDRFDLAVIIATAAAMLLWFAAPTSRLTGLCLLAAGFLQAARLARWRGLATIKEPLLLVLHVGYLWLGVALFLLGLGTYSGIVPQSASMHGLGIGAVGTMILAVATRASLGHTGRTLRAGPAMVVGYGLISAAALVRMATALGWIDYRTGLLTAGVMWILAFLLFLVIFVPVLTQPRQESAD